LEDKYGGSLAVIGVHSAKFPAEKVTENIRQAATRHHLRHPIANDASFRIWRAYGIHAWPTLVLIDPQGKLLGQAAGEGNVEALDKAIGQLVQGGKVDPDPRIQVRIRPEGRELRYPGKVAVGGSPERLFISDTGHHRVLCCDLDGAVRAAYGSGERGLADGPAAQARFDSPQGLWAEDGILYVADTENHAIRAVDLAQGTVSTLAGTGKQARWGARGGQGKETALNSPWDVLVQDRCLIVAMAGSHQIWRMNLGSGGILPWIGNGRENILDGPAGAAELAQPSGLALQGDVLYIADSESSAVRAFDLRSETLKTLVGTGLFDFGDAEGGGGNVLQHPLAVLADGKDVIVADTYNHRLKRLHPATGRVRFWLGAGKAGYADGKDAAFFEPSGLALHDGKLYVADTNNHRVRVVDMKTGETSTLPVARQAVAP
jgi:sugar lactone lactonase YvrE